MISFTFYLLHSVCHFTNASMIWKYGLFFIQPLAIAFTFYILHSVSHFTYASMIWTNWLFLNWTTGRSFYLLHPVSHYKYALMIWTMDSVWIEPLVTAFTFYLLHSVSHFTYALMLWSYGLFLNWTNNHVFYLLPFTSS